LIGTTFPVESTVYFGPNALSRSGPSVFLAADLAAVSAFIGFIVSTAGADTESVFVDMAGAGSGAFVSSWGAGFLPPHAEMTIAPASIHRIERINASP
jgi:hypothetical protein